MFSTSAPQTTAPATNSHSTKRVVFHNGLFISSLIPRSNVTTTIHPTWQQCLSLSSSVGYVAFRQIKTFLFRRIVILLLKLSPCSLTHSFLNTIWISQHRNSQINKVTYATSHLQLTHYLTKISTILRVMPKFSSKCQYFIGQQFFFSALL